MTCLVVTTIDPRDLSDDLFGGEPAGTLSARPVRLTA